MKRPIKAALYLRVSTDGQTVENQRIALEALCERKGWTVAAEFSDEGISGSKGRDKRPGFARAIREARGNHYDVLVVWSVDRLGRSTLHIAEAMAELSGANVALFVEQQGIDSTNPHGKAMIQMAAVFGELERSLIVARVKAGLDRARKAGKMLGRPRIAGEREQKIRDYLAAETGVKRIAKLLGCGVNAVMQIKREMQAAGLIAQTAQRAIGSPASTRISGP